MKNRSHKAQSGLELITLVSYSLLVFTVVYLSILQNNFTLIKEKRNMEFQKMSEWVTYELDIATGIGHGYSKNITLPATVVGESYNIIISDNLVIINSSSSYITKSVTPNITGTIDPGFNSIENRDGLIYVSH
ncbi:MAG: hypothetical protein ABIG84_00450 [archaeon]